MAGCDVRLYGPELKDQWDDFIGVAKNTNFLFFRDYMDYHRDRFVDHSLMFYLDGDLVGCLPATCIGRTLHSHQGLTYGGLVMHPDIRLKVVFSTMSSLAAHLRERNFDGLVYHPMPYIYHRLPADEDLEAFNSLGGRIIATKAICAIRTGKDRNSFSENRRYDVQRFKKTGLAVARSYDFEDFMTLCESHLARRFSAKPVHTMSEIRTLANNFPNHIRLYAVHSRSRMIAGAILYSNPGCAKIQYFAHDDIGKEAGAAPAIYAYILDEVLPPNSWLELGHSVGSNGQINEGVHTYKESFGARTIQIRTYLLDPNIPRQI
jgi:hypothetical protein